MRQSRNYIYKGSTMSTCPVCRKLVNTRVHEKQNKIYFEKYCPQHGHSTAMVSSDAEWSNWARDFVKPGEVPIQMRSEVKNGCPSDCGLCTDHEQHSCFTQVEITDMCDLNCPWCYMGPQNKWYLPVERASWMFDRLVENEGEPEVVTLTGGEPTLHPDFFKIADLALSKGVQYVLVNTNGNKIAKDLDFAKKMADTGLFCYLQVDGFTDEVYRKLRGRELLNNKMKALENLEKANVQTILAPVIAKGINEDQAGELIQYGVKHDFVKCVSFQPMTFVRQFKGKKDGWGHGEDGCTDPLTERITLPEMLDYIETYTNGLIPRKDFMPVPCHHPECGAVTYLLKGEDGITMTINNIIDVEPFLDFIKNRSRVEAEDLYHVTQIGLKKLYDICTIGGEKEFNGIQKMMDKCCEDMDLFEGKMLQISVHMFMDAHTWDMNRGRKCCIHFMLPSGKVIPFCQYNIFHRDEYRKTNMHTVEKIEELKENIKPTAAGVKEATA